jgi:hypothetical protein
VEPRGRHHGQPSVPRRPCDSRPGMILLLIALVHGDVPEARRPRAIGFALALAGTVLAALLWLT